MNRRFASLGLGFFCVLGGAALGVYGCTSDDPPVRPSGTSDSGTTADTGGPLPDSGGTQDSGKDTGAADPTAKADLAPTGDAGAFTGVATFVEKNNAVTVTISVSGATEGLHGMHIHQNPSCAPTTDDAGVVTPGGGAGTHWNPADGGHGFPDAGGHHFGDMGNISVDDAGKGTLSLTSTEWTVKAGGASVVDHAIIFHGLPDDGVTPGTGGAGPRVGCGVVKSVP